MKIVGPLVILFMTLMSQMSLACSCVDIPCTFFNQEIGPKDHVVHVRVIGETAMDDGSRYAQMNNTLTQLLVLKDFTNKISVDTILFYHGDGAMCFMSLYPKELGQEFILRISLLREQNPGVHADHIYRMELCSRPVLNVSGKRVKGMITKNKSCARRKRAMAKQLDRPDTNGMLDYDKLPKERKREQCISIRKFARIWNRYEETQD